jgi:hypothetical protein
MNCDEEIRKLLEDTAKAIADYYANSDYRTYCHLVKDLSSDFAEVVHRTFSDSRIDVSINIGDVIRFSTTSWQTREENLEDKDIIVLDKWIDYRGKVMYQISPIDELLPNSIPMRQIAVSEAVLQAVKSNLIDRFIYVGLGPGKTTGRPWIHVDF